MTLAQIVPSTGDYYKVSADGIVTTGHSPIGQIVVKRSEFHALYFTPTPIALGSFPTQHLAVDALWSYAANEPCDDQPDAEPFGSDPEDESTFQPRWQTAEIDRDRLDDEYDADLVGSPSPLDSAPTADGPVGRVYVQPYVVSPHGIVAIGALAIGKIWISRNRDSWLAEWYSPNQFEPIPLGCHKTRDDAANTVYVAFDSLG